MYLQEGNAGPGKLLGRNELLQMVVVQEAKFAMFLCTMVTMEDGNRLLKVL